MGSEFLSRKPHYDITMSKRTRKPTNSNLINIQESADHHQSAENCISATVKMNQVVNEGIIQGDDDDEESKKSLKQLIEGRRRGTSLGEHFTAEEKQLQVAVVKAAAAEDGGGSNGVKFKHMISRYTKVLSHMMKLRRDASKPHFRLKVQQLQK
ncbi:PREDICTED: uncharacterized protein LOC109186438 [Ipomoea nil]|uniref:uncharacterized protein LOC109186438 n=1 Tax=Ipomoea nil TaxID=35883 RepID=UPI000900E61E|nr:PREDICTED: uncharacterized protein LOC109186438 [Ipomoea nil]